MTSPSSSASGLGFSWVIPDRNTDSESGIKPVFPSHGRACTNCVKAKARCSGGDIIANGGKCERCHRMRKDCHPSPAVRKRTRVKPSTKTAQLEEKLEGLVELLKSATQPPQKVTPPIIPFSGPPTLPPLNDTATNCYHAPLTVNPVPREPFRAVIQYAPTPPASNHSPRSATTSTPNLWEPSAREAEEQLNLFRTQYIPFLPFINIPAETTVQELQQSRPFLWHSILTLCSKSTLQQRACANEFRAVLGREAFVEGTKNVDLLLAVLVYASWDQHHCFYKHIMGNLVHYSAALVFDLGLHKVPPKSSQSILLEYDDRGCPKPYRSPIRTLEERRTVLGCFLLTSLASSYFGKGEPLSWSAYMEECCEVLEEEKEAANDILLIQMVRVQLIMDKAIKSPWRDAGGDASVGKAPVTFYIKALESQMQDLKRNLPHELQQSEVLLLEIYAAEITIYEMALSKAPGLVSDPDFQRLEYLYACLRTIKSWFDLFLSIPISRFVGFPLQMFRHIGHCAISLYRLSTCEFQDWDTEYVRSSVNLSSLLGQVFDRLRLVKNAVGLDVDTVENIDTFHFLAEKLSNIKTYWDNKIATEGMGPVARPDNDLAMDVEVEWGGETWYPELLAPWDGLDRYFSRSG